MKPLKVALLGCGTVGSEVVRLLHEQADDLTARIGAPVELAGIAVRRPDHDRRRPRATCSPPTRSALVSATTSTSSSR